MSAFGTFNIAFDFYTPEGSYYVIPRVVRSSRLLLLFVNFTFDFYSPSGSYYVIPPVVRSFRPSVRPLAISCVRTPPTVPIRSI